MEKSSKETTEEKVVKAAISEFAEHGFAGARMDRIADRAKINKAMIYYHFKSKESLYESIFEDKVKEIFGRIQEVVIDGKEPLDQLYTIISRYIHILDELNPEILRVLLREFASGGKYFRKVAVPNLILPIQAIVAKIFKEGKEKDIIRDIHPFMTFIQIIGGIVFFNLIKNMLKGTEVEKVLLQGNYTAAFEDNLLQILKHSIEKKEE